MFRPFRLIMLAAIGLGVYVGFFQAPGGKPGPADFDPAVVAAHEIDAWKAAKGREDVATMIAHTLQLRELHRLSWYRAVQAGMETGRVSYRFVLLRARYELVLENLKGALAAEQAWTKRELDVDAVARAQLDWMTVAREPNLRDPSDGPASMSTEYSARWGVRSDLMYSAAALRFEAFRAMVTVGTDPDWPAISKLLEDSYGELRKALLTVQTAR